MRTSLLDAFHAGSASVFDTLRQLDEASGLDASGRKLDGVVYTPPAVARSMVRLLQIGEQDTVLEPSCGRGVFLFALAQHWVEDRGWSWERTARWAEQHLFAQDLDAQAVKDLALLWTGLFARHGVVSDLRPNLRAGDALFAAWSDRPFDLILGNPPYVRFQNLPDAYRVRLQERYPSCAKGNVDLYYAFMEQALCQARRWCLITPNSWLANASAKALRAALHPRVDAVIDFQARLVFAPVRAYVSIVLVGEARPDAGSVRYRHDLPEEGGDVWHSTPRDGARLNDARGWNLRDADAFHTHDGDTLDDHATVHGGIATLADGTFTLPTSSVARTARGPMVVTTDPLRDDATVRVPLDLAPRLFKLTKAVDRASLLAQTARILCPYDSGWAVVHEPMLRAHAPDVLAWFDARRAKLLGRDKGDTAGYEAWYAYGRRQGFYSFPDDERLLLIPVMTTGPLAPIEVTAGELGGRFLIQSGYVVRTKDPARFDEVKAMLASEATWQAIRRDGKAWAGGKDYRTFGARLLRQVPFHAPMG